MEKHLLSKSTFIRGTQCLKSLYLYKNRNFLRDPLSAEQRAKFTRGSEVGVFARNLFPGGINCQPNSPSQYRKAIEKTRGVIESGSHDVIYEAAFQYDQVLILADILVKENSRWTAYEVKSSLKISETYQTDAALQYYVLTNAGIDLKDFFLIHINPEYQRNKGLNIQELFSFQSVKKIAEEKQDWVKNLIAEQKKIINAGRSPKIDIGEYCDDPYPCDFIGHCWKKVPAGSVFGLTSFSKQDRFALYRDGIKEVNEIPKEKIRDRNQQAEVNAFENHTDHLDFNRLGLFLNRIKPSFKFIHFVGRKPAIPLFEAYKPYNIDAISISLYTNKLYDRKIITWMNSGNGKARDEEVIAFLNEHVDENVTPVMYGRELMKEYLLQVAERKPALAADARRIAESVVNLADIFSEFIYLRPGLGARPKLTDVASRLLKEPVEKQIPIFSNTMAVNEFEKLEQADTMVEKEKIAENLRNYSSMNLNYLRKLYRFMQLNMMD